MIEKGGGWEETMEEKWGFEGMMKKICECVCGTCVWCGVLCLSVFWYMCVVCV